MTISATEYRAISRCASFTLSSTGVSLNSIRTSFQPNWRTELIAGRTSEACRQGAIKRLIINVPHSIAR